MQRIYVSVFSALAMTAALTMATVCAAQAAPARPAASETGLEVAFTYNATLTEQITNSRFWMQGGSAQIHGLLYRGLGVVADISGAHIANINSTGVGLDLVTATFGPRYTWTPARSRVSVFGQGLLGIANGFNGIFPNPQGVDTTTESMAVKAGAGLNLRVTPHLSLRLAEADYLRTQLPNSTNNAQNSLQLATGLVLRFR
jgi:hypothetical protein